MSKELLNILAQQDAKATPTRTETVISPLKRCFMLIKLFLVAGLVFEGAFANAYYCRLSTKTSGQFGPAYNNGDWVDDSPTTSLKICMLQVQQMKSYRDGSSRASTVTRRTCSCYEDYNGGHQYLGQAQYGSCDQDYQGVAIRQYNCN